LHFSCIFSTHTHRSVLHVFPRRALTAASVEDEEHEARVATASIVRALSTHRRTDSQFKALEIKNRYKAAAAAAAEAATLLRSSSTAIAEENDGHSSSISAANTPPASSALAARLTGTPSRMAPVSISRGVSLSAGLGSSLSSSSLPQHPHHQSSGFGGSVSDAAFSPPPSPPPVESLAARKRSQRLQRQLKRASLACLAMEGAQQQQLQQQHQQRPDFLVFPAGHRFSNARPLGSSGSSNNNSSNSNLSRLARWFALEESAAEESAGDESEDDLGAEQEEAATTLDSAPTAADVAAVQEALAALATDETDANQVDNALLVEFELNGPLGLIATCLLECTSMISLPFAGLAAAVAAAAARRTRGGRGGR
jgi:hypothetical protein